MNYLVDEDVSAYWDFIIDQFVNQLNYDISINNMPEVIDLQFRVKNGSLSIVYNGGDRITDAYARFAVNLAERICSNCGETRNADASVILKSLSLCERCG